MTPMTNDEYLAQYHDHWEITGDGYRIYSATVERYFTGPTLTIARHNRSESERFYREHHAKNASD